MKNSYSYHSTIQKANQGCFLLIVFIFTNFLQGQVSSSGFVVDDFGIDVGLYSGIIESGKGTSVIITTDWFLGPISTDSSNYYFQLQSLIFPNILGHYFYNHEEL